MKPTDWQSLRDLFEQAMSLPEKQRQAFVDSQTNINAELGRELQILVSADSADISIEASIDQANQFFQAGFEERFVGQQIGPYRVTELLGKGGMGLVYRAQRVVGNFSQDVAIKFLRDNNTQLARRLMVEQQSLSSLNHPNIAKIIDAGTTQAGAPYLIMEYIDGLGLGQYLEQQLLDLPQKLVLFQSVCQAVDHSHRHLIIHRDLKPSNIMLDSDGRPKLIDYGIAKQLTLANDENQTITMEQAWSPNYASPEQIRGETLSTATDIYGLGLVLYRLLTGEDAQPVQHLSLEQAIHRICDQHPPNPAVMGVPKDLAKIIVKAIHKDPQQRYASAKELNDDLQRFRDGQAVLAVGDGIIYRCRKWVGRHRLTTAVAAMAVTLLMIAFQQVTSQRNVALISESRALSAEADSRLQLQRSNEVAEFLTNIFEAADIRENGGEATSAQALIDQAFANIQRRQNLEPELKIELLRTIAKAYANGGYEPKALHSLKLALSAWTLLNDGDVLQRAMILNDMGNVHMRQEDNAQAIILLEESLIIQRANQPMDEAQVAQTLNNIGSALATMNNLDAARQSLTQSLQLMQVNSEISNLSLSAVYHNLARIENRSGHPELGMDYINRALDIKRKNYGEDQVPYADGLHVRSQIARSMSDWDQVGHDLTQAYAIIQDKLPADNWRNIRMVGELANYYHDIGQFKTAETFYRRKLADPTAGRLTLNRAVALNNLGSLYEDMQDYQRALPLYEESRDIRRQQLGERASRYATTTHNLGRLMIQLRRFDDSEQLLEEALGIRLEQLEKDHFRVISIELDRLRLALYRGECSTCEVQFKAVTNRMQTTHQGTNNWVKLYSLQAEYWTLREQPAQAYEQWLNAYKHRVESVGENHPLAQQLVQKMETVSP